MRPSRIAVLVLLLALLPAPTRAAEPGDAGLLEALAGTCDVPTAARLLALHPAAPERLVAIALDTGESGYVRSRAVTLLSMFPDARTEADLAVLMEVGPEPLRALALYTYARMFAELAPDLVVERLAPYVVLPGGRLRDDAVRGLGWVRDPAARRLLEAQHAAVRDAGARELLERSLARQKTLD